MQGQCTIKSPHLPGSVVPMDTHTRTGNREKIQHRGLPKVAFTPRGRLAKPELRVVLEEFGFSWFFPK